MNRFQYILTAVIILLLVPTSLLALSSPNIPLGSPVYAYLDKLAALGYVASDFTGLKPVTRSEAARLLLEAESRRGEAAASPLAAGLIAELQSYLQRELSLYNSPGQAASVEIKPLADIAVRYLYLDGEPRSYARGVHDPGGEGVFGIGGGLRPENPYPTIALQQGSEGTPLLENNEGNRYAAGSSVDVRINSEAHIGRIVSALVEPRFISTPGVLTGRLNKGYVKIGGGGFELEAGRDANWLGFGQRGALTLSNNAKNFDLIKLSSPEPLDAGFLGKLKYALIVSQFDKAVTAHGERQPWFYAIKCSLKPVPSFEIGFNLGRQQGGPGVSNTLRDNLQGVVGGTAKDNSNSLGGIELRWRLAFLRNTELFVEYSGEDAAKFWPFVESYLAGIFIPRLTDSGSDDLRLEYFYGNNILYTHDQFTEGYLYKGLPIGHAQGGAAQDIFLEYRHWFSARESVGIDYFNTQRGISGRLPGQAIEEKHAVRGFWAHPLAARLDLKLTYGWEKVRNPDLQYGSDRTNNIFVAETAYRF
jgi:hypothetical protein